jgi:hypothetical protein
MYYAFVFICAIASVCPMRVDDRLGPYQTAEECYLRGAQLIRDITILTPVIQASANCSPKAPAELFEDDPKKKQKTKEKFEEELNT